MKTGLKIVAVIFLLAVLVTAWWQYQYPSASWRYKITVEIETPEGVKTGSAVREVHYQGGPKILPDVSGSQTNTKGEAVVVDMGDEKYLFALMDTNGSYKIVYDTFPYKPTDVHDFVKYYQSLVGEKRELERKGYPMMVTFTDINDPKTVTQIFPDDLSRTFGAGVKLKDISIEMTDEPVTWGIDTVLSWLPSRRNVRGYIGGTEEEWTKDPTGTFLTGIEFSRGRYW